MDLLGEEAATAMPTWGRRAPVARRDKGSLKEGRPCEQRLAGQDEALSEIPGAAIVGKDIDEQVDDGKASVY
jgi:hypothetical protein